MALPKSIPAANADSGTLLPAELCRFPAPAGADPAGWHERLVARLAEFARHAEQDPYANPIQLLALEIGRRIDEGALALGELEQLIQRLVLASFQERCTRLGQRLEECDPA